ncbi:WecB/TagA/CpsF family glycosyltransferase [Dermacoccaceae bacterium W4C1]
MGNLDRGRIPIRAEEGRVLVFGEPAFTGPMEQVLEEFARLRHQGGVHSVVTCNVDQLLSAAETGPLRRAYSEASLITLDGFPLVRLAEVVGAQASVHRLTGADLLPAVAAESARRGWRVVILGGGPGVAERAAAALSGPGRDVVGLDFPLVRSLTEPGAAEVVQQLADLRPDVVFVCLGSPKQEEFVTVWRPHLPDGIYIGAGAAVDFAAGVVRRAPHLVQRAGMEWLWRVGQEPRRLARRYFVRGPRFLGLAGQSLRARSLPAQDSPLRVLHVVKALDYGGAESVLVSLTHWLADRGHQVMVVGRDGPLRGRLHPEVRFTKVADSSSPVADAAALTRAVRRFRPDVIHAHQRREAVIAQQVARSFGIPVVEHAHTVLPSTQLARLSFRSQRVFAVSADVQAMLKSDFGREDGVVLVGNAPAARTQTPPTDVDGELPAGLRIVNLARVTEQKDPQRFLEVVEALARTVPVAAEWYGEGDLLAQVAAEARRRHLPITFPGTTDAPIQKLDAAHLLLITSRWEGRPLVVLEAMARHRLVAAAAAPGVSDLVQERGVLVPADCAPEEFADALLAVLRDPARWAALVGSAAAFVDQVASPDAVFAPVETAYHEVRKAVG